MLVPPLVGRGAPVVSPRGWGERVVVEVHGMGWCGRGTHGSAVAQPRPTADAVPGLTARAISSRPGRAGTARYADLVSGLTTLDVHHTPAEPWLQGSG